MLALEIGGRLRQRLDVGASLYAAPRLSRSSRRCSIWLVYLLENRERVVSKDDLIAAVWRGRIVSIHIEQSHQRGCARRWATMARTSA